MSSCQMRAIDKDRIRNENGDNNMMHLGQETKRKVAKREWEGCYMLTWNWFPAPVRIARARNLSYLIRPEPRRAIVTRSLRVAASGVDDGKVKEEAVCSAVRVYMGGTKPGWFRLRWLSGAVFCDGRGRYSMRGMHVKREEQQRKSCCAAAMLGCLFRDHMTQGRRVVARRRVGIQCKRNWSHWERFHRKDLNCCGDELFVAMGAGAD